MFSIVWAAGSSGSTVSFVFGWIQLTFCVYVMPGGGPGVASGGSAVMSTGGGRHEIGAASASGETAGTVRDDNPVRDDNVADDGDSVCDIAIDGGGDTVRDGNTVNDDSTATSSTTVISRA
jgi:hypothetical protein